tara:strand:- start:328 stop:666 length:339 start_codon:yes stop_codon:yes gene_type:complete
MSKEVNENKEAQEIEQDPSAAEVVEIPAEDAKEATNIRMMLLETQQYLSQLMLDHEKRKRALLENIDTLERDLYTAATKLQKEHSVNPEWTYEFKLPSQPGEKAYFIRKEDS